ncbi:MAG TPA: GDSL family lipase [Flavobacterium sp.]|nr:GDSL family lipase [Flavobacterium sp.]
MKTFIIAALFFLSLTSCSSQSDMPTPTPVIDTNTLYPSPSIVIPYHTDWTKTHYIEKIAEFKTNPLQTGDIVFIGNSITEQGGDWGQRFNNPKIKNRGIAGDVTAGVLNRLAEIYHYKPKKVFIKIGINDLFHNELTPEYVANNIKLIVDKIHLESPTTKIYVQTILPTANNNPSKERIAATNTILKAMTPTNYLQIIDLHSRFADKNDLMIASYTNDGLHLTELGYLAWQYYIIEFVNN